VGRRPGDHEHPVRGPAGQLEEPRHARLLPAGAVPPPGAAQHRPGAGPDHARDHHPGIQHVAGRPVRPARRHGQPADRQLLRPRHLQRGRRRRLGHRLGRVRLRLRPHPGHRRHAPGRQGEARRERQQDRGLVRVPEAACGGARLRGQRRGRCPDPAVQVEPDVVRGPEGAQR
jgi:hypothetical protein